MATGKVWKENINELSDDELEIFKNSLRNLSDWPLFMEEFFGSSLKQITSLLEEEIDKRDEA